MTTASKVIKIARKQIGICESPANSNRQKFGKDYGWNGTFWCAQFVWWCGWKASGKKQADNPIAKSASAAYIQEETVKKGGKWIMKKNKSSKTRKAYLKKAKPGDIVSFDFGAYDAVRDHTGLVASVSGDYVICIEGNTSERGSQSNGGMVCEQRRHYSSICSAVRPSYTGEKSEAKEQTKAEKKDAENGDFKVGETYVIATKKDPLNIRKGAGTNLAILGSIPKGKKVKCLEVRNGWLKVKYNGIAGYISGEYVKEV